MSTQSPKPTNPGRRKWLLGGALVTAGAAGVGGWALWRWRRFEALEPNARKLAWFLSTRVGHFGLDIGDEIIETWIGEHLRLHGPLRRAPRGVSDKLLQSLVLSTDRYTTGVAEPQAITRFVSYYDPHKNACYNPLRGS